MSSDVALEPHAQSHQDSCAWVPKPDANDCTHCGLPLEHAVRDESGRQFCCPGCRGAYAVIHQWGLQDYYQLKQQLTSGVGTAAPRVHDSYAGFDDPDFLGQSNPVARPDGTVESKLALHGLHCAACTWLIETLAQRTDGWLNAYVRLADHTLRVVYDPKQLRLSEIASLLASVGYELAPLAEQPENVGEEEQRRLLVNLAVAGFCAANAMWIAVALYAGASTGVSLAHQQFLQCMGVLLSTVAVLGPGRIFLRGAWASVRQRVPHMDLPVALGLLAGMISGLASILLGAGAAYFDSVTMLVFLLLVGRWIQMRQQHRAARSIEHLLQLSPRHARRLSPNLEERWVMSESLTSEDVIRVLPQESFPADGELVRGSTKVDLSLLTGESTPQSVRQGDKIFAGTLNLQRSVDVRVTAVGKKARIGSIIQEVEHALDSKPSAVQFADRLGAHFVIVVLSIAAIAFAYWSRIHIAMAAEVASSVLIVACPCALALATPLAIAVALGQAAKQRILIRDGQSLDTLATRGKIWFDKTGTLTVGRPRVVRCVGTESALVKAASIEQHSNHPIAVAVCEAAQSNSLHGLEAGQLIESTQNGVRGMVEGVEVLVGNLSFLVKHHVPITEQGRQLHQSMLEQSLSPCLIAIAGEHHATLGIGDQIKPGAAGVIQSLKQAGWKVGILSGDHPGVVDTIARTLGVDESYGGLSPEEKVQFVTATRPEKCVMVGDGANDAAALMAADTGIAVQGGAEVCLQSAPVYVAGSEINSVALLCAAARRTRVLIITAISVSLMYNAAAVALATTGMISPLLAAILMPASSLSVLALTTSWPIMPKTMGGLP